MKRVSDGKNPSNACPQCTFASEIMTAIQTSTVNTYTDDFDDQIFI